MGRSVEVMIKYFLVVLCLNSVAASTACYPVSFYFNTIKASSGGLVYDALDANIINFETDDTVYFSFFQGTGVAGLSSGKSGATYATVNENGHQGTTFAVIKGDAWMQTCFVLDGITQAKWSFWWQDRGRVGSGASGIQTYLFNISNEQNEVVTSERYNTLTNTPTGDDWDSRTSAPVDLGPGTYTIIFKGIGTGAAYLDKFSIIYKGPLPFTTSKLTSSSITSARLTTASLTTSPLTTAPFTTASVTSSVLTTNEMTSMELSTSEVTTDSLTTNEITSGQITSASLTTGEKVGATQRPTTEGITSLSAQNITVRDGNFTVLSNDSVKNILSRFCSSVPSNCVQEVVNLKLNSTSRKFLGSFLIPLPDATSISIGNISARIGIPSGFLETKDIVYWIFELRSLTKPTLPLFNISSSAGNNWKDFNHTNVDIRPYVNDSGLNIYVTAQSNGTQTNNVDGLFVDTLDLSYVTAQADKDFQIADATTKPNNRMTNLLLAIIIPVTVVIVAGVIIAVLLVARRNKRKYQQAGDIQLESKKTGIKVISDIKIGKRIGGGNYGDVYEAIYNGTIKVAAKKLFSAEEFLSEAQISESLVHPNCVLFLGIFHDEEDQYIITEFCENGSLLNHLVRNQNKLKEIDLLKYCLGAATGMAYLEQNRVAHRDLACRNLLLKGSVVKVADFGLSRSLKANEYESKGSNFPIRWSSPESIMFQKFTSKSDVWSLGVTLFEIMSYGETPYVDQKNDEVVKLVCDANQQNILYRPKGCRNDIWEIIESCLKREPNERPTLTEVSQRIQAILDKEMS